MGWVAQIDTGRIHGMKIGYAHLLLTEDQTLALPLPRCAACLPAYVLAISLLTAVPPAVAQEYKSDNITVERAWAPATPKGAEVGAGYFTIRNDGASPDRLTGLAADIGTLELHEMKTENGVMSMPELKDGLSIPAHGAVSLAPGSYHVMFAHLKHPLVKGGKVKAVLTFEHAPPLTVEFSVERVGASAPSTGKDGDMGRMKL
jgi:copper(I)-binding protein